MKKISVFTILCIIVFTNVNSVQSCFFMDYPEYLEVQILDYKGNPIDDNDAKYGDFILETNDEQIKFSDIPERIGRKIPLRKNGIVLTEVGYEYARHGKITVSYKGNVFTVPMDKYDFWWTPTYMESPIKYEYNDISYNDSKEILKLLNTGNYEIYNISKSITNCDNVFDDYDTYTLHNYHKNYGYSKDFLCNGKYGLYLCKYSNYSVVEELYIKCNNTEELEQTLKNNKYKNIIDIKPIIQDDNISYIIHYDFPMVRLIEEKTCYKVKSLVLTQK